MERRFADRYLGTVHDAATAASAEHHGTLIHAVEAIAAGDFESFGEFLTDDAELIIRGSGLFDGNWQGRANVVEASRKNFGMLDQQTPEIVSMVAEGDKIAVLMSERGIVKADGKPYAVRAAQWFTFRDDKISRIEEICAPAPD